MFLLESAQKAENPKNATKFLVPKAVDADDKEPEDESESDEDEDSDVRSSWWKCIVVLFRACS